MMLGNTGAFLTSKLPYDAEVEYLESTGTQWIDTGYNPHGREPIMSVDMMSIGVQSYINMFGCGGDIPYFWLTAGGIAWAVGIGGGYGGTRTLSEYANIRVTTVLNARALTASIASTSYLATVGAYSRNLPDANVCLFDCNNGLAGRTPFVGRIYGCTIEDESGLGRDMIPIRFTNEQGVSEGAMYDRVNPTVGMDPDGSPRTDGLYRNRGTGSFVIGPDKTA